MSLKLAAFSSDPFAPDPFAPLHPFAPTAAFDFAIHLRACRAVLEAGFSPRPRSFPGSEGFRYARGRARAQIPESVSAKNPCFMIK